jgi:ABC-type Fe3+-hydroxamate transport system substrate-binding protein
MYSNIETDTEYAPSAAKSPSGRLPGRIISLVPSLTELVFFLGMGNRLVGRTRFCIHPEQQIGGVEIIGGTKNPRIEKIKALKPDIVIANREENRKEDVDAISSFSEVLVTEISTVKEALNEMLRIGEALGKAQEAAGLVDAISREIPGKSPTKSLRALYLIWREPWMAAGGDTYIHDVMQLFGLQNVCAGMDRYPQLTEEQICNMAPEVILLSSEPYPFRKKHVNEMAGLFSGSRKYRPWKPDEIKPHEAGYNDRCAGAPIVLAVDGEWFSWYGPRMLPSFRSLAGWRQKL